MGELSITAIDVVVVAVILVSAGYAMFRGLIHETFDIIEWVAAAYVALRFTPVFRPLLQGYISPPWLEWVAVFVGTFLIVFIPLSIMSNRIADAVKKSEIGPIDRTLGLVFGIGRGLVIVGIAYIAYATLVPLTNHPDTLTKARLFPLIRNTSDVLLSLAPQSENGIAGMGRRALGLPAAPEAETSAAKSYGANERSALDRLFETNGGDEAPSQ